MSFLHSRKPPSNGKYGLGWSLKWGSGILFIALIYVSACQSRRNAVELIQDHSYRPAQGRFHDLPNFKPYGVRDAGHFLEGFTSAEYAAWKRYGQEIDRELMTNPSARRLREGAYLDTALGRYERAVVRLEELQSVAGGSPAVKNDLAVVLVERALVKGHPLDLLEALRLSSQAVSSHSGCSACVFNHALILSLLHLRHLARAEWQHFLELGPTAAWRMEAEGWLALLDDDSYEQDLEVMHRELRSMKPVEEERLRHLVTIFPQEARALVEEEILLLWAEASAAGEVVIADRLLERAEFVGQELARRGAWLLADGLRRIRDGPQHHLILGHETFGQAMRAYHDQNFTLADELFATAGDSFHAASSIYAEVALLYQAICVYYQDVDSARPLFEVLLGRVSARRHPILAARTLWMLGILDMVQRRTDLALERFTETRSLLEIGAGIDRAAIADTMIAETLELRGEVERGWHHRLDALARLVYRSDLRRRHSVLLEAAQALARRDDPELALIFFGEVVANAEQWGQPLGLAEAYSARARAQVLLGNLTSAALDTRFSFDALARMPLDDPLRQRTTSLTRFYLGMAWAEQDPERGLSMMREAHKELEAGGWKEERLKHLQWRTRAFLALGDVQNARKNLLASVQEIESMRTQTGDTMSRLEILQHAQSAHDQLIRLALQEGGHERTIATRSFDQAERARVRVMFLNTAEDRTPTERILQELPPGEILVLFTTLPETLLVWVVEDGKLSSLDLGIHQLELKRLTDLFRDALHASDHGTAKRVGSKLYSLLIEPLEIDDTTGRRLVVVPDLMLAEIPFAAFFDPKTRRYLIEKIAIVQAPSAMLYLDSLERKSERSGVPSSVLAVGEPSLVGSPFEYLPALPRAREEANSVAALYRFPRILLGAEATPSQVLAALPTFDVFHFAGHALASGPSHDDSLLLLTPDNEGLSQLSADDLRRLELSQTKVVVLAACSSADGIRKGREATASLAGAFLGAGVPTVVASLWDVDDQRSLHLMPRLHEYLAAGEDAAQAYRQIVLDLLNAENSEQRQPSYWAIFSVLGA